METPDSVNLSDLVTEYYAVRFALSAALVWAVYDYILTLDNEIEHVWLRPWGLPMFLYFWTRYVGMAVLAILLVASLETSQPQIYCTLVFGFGAWGGLVTMATVSVIMILRVWAMYGGNKKILLILCTLLMIHLTAECTIFGLIQAEASSSPPSTPPLAYLETGLNACFFVSSSSAFIGVWISRLIFDFILFGMTLNKSWVQYRAGWTSSLVDLLIQDNVLAFGLVFFTQISNLLITLFAKATTTDLGVGFAIATDVIVGSRLLLHTRQVIYGGQPGGYETEFLDTQFSRIEMHVPSRRMKRQAGSFASIDEVGDDDMGISGEADTVHEEQESRAV